MKERIKLLIADDREKERAALRKLLAASAIDVIIVGETGVGTETLTAAEDVAPHVILLSLEEPLARPLRILESLALTGTAPIIALSSIGERDCLRKAMRAGAKEYLVRPLNAEDLATAIESIYAAEQHRKSLLSSGSTVSARAQGEVITVFSAKGGTGKTTLAANLAVALALETERRVALLDLNLEQGDVPLMLDVVPEKTVLDLVQIIDRVESDMIEGFLCMHSSGVKVLAAPNEMKAGELINSQHVRKIIMLLAKLFDYVVIDTPPNLSATVLAAFELSNEIFLITTPQITCLKNSRIVLELLKSQHPYGSKVKIVVNDAYMPDGISHAEVGRALDYPIFWKIPYDTLVVESIKVGEPFVLAKSAGKVSRNVSDLARILGGVQKQRKKLLGIFGK
ncbi:MAG: P-loop NTPase [Chloroflexi bacterium]|nr:P-loop NTPase [Chloroflexota bacterium]